MIFNRLKIINFRCFSSFEIEFFKGINIITGYNATGKTSILEALNFLALTKSFRTNDENQLIAVGKNEMAVLGRIEKDQKTFNYKIIKQNKGKQVTKDNYKYPKLSEYLGEILIVSLTNFDLINLLGTPKERRKIIEPIICQISKFYTDECNYYKKLLNERNALLKRLIFEKNSKTINLLKTLDLQLASCAKNIISQRMKFIQKINLEIKKYYGQIANVNENFEIKYVPSVASEKFLKILEENLEEDIKKGSTNYGPHRDDYVFIINNKNIITYGSQGQQRSALISTKLAFVNLLKEEKNDYPILILDDVLSDLDKYRQNNVFRLLNKEVQTIISSSTLADLDEDIKKNAMVTTLEREMKQNGWEKFSYYWSGKAV